MSRAAGFLLATQWVWGRQTDPVVKRFLCADCQGGNLGPDPSETPNVVQKTAQLLSAWSCWQQTSEGALFCSVCLLDLPLFGERSVSSCLANFCWLPALFLMYEGRQQRRDPVRNCYWLPNPNRFFLQFFCKFYARSQLWILRSSQ